MESHFAHSLSYFSKYDRSIKKKVSPQSYQEATDPPDICCLEKNEYVDREKLNYKQGAALSHSLLPSEEKFNDLILQIKSELLDKKVERNVDSIKIGKLNYIKTFIIIYLGLLKYNINIFVNKSIG
jgi:hypothetical protein